MKNSWTPMLMLKDGRTLLAMSEVCLLLIAVIAIWRGKFPPGLTLGLTAFCIFHGLMLWNFMKENKRAEHNLVVAKEAADQANLTRGAFLSTMSHEIRTPMNAIVGMTELLRGTRLDSQQQEFAKAIEDSANALLGIVNDVLDFSKIDVGKLDIAVMEFDLAEVVESCADVLSFKSREKHVRLISYIAPKIPLRLVGDAGRIRQILLNLIGNALKFTNEGEVIVKVSLLHHVGDRCRIRIDVTDTGIGMDPETIQRLFSPFSQADSSVTRKYGGTGLGLSICKRLVELMGGKIGVTSTLNHGSCFWFELAMPIVKPAANSADAPTDSSLTVALIEPHGDCARMIEDYLQAAGIGVIRFKDASNIATITIKGQAPDVVIMSSEMGNMAAHSLMKGIRDANPNTRCILIAHGIEHNGADRDESYEVLQLPVRRKQLLSIVLGRQEIFKSPSQEMGSHQLHAVGSEEILLVEDNTMNQKVAIYQLNAMGYGAEIAGNGEEALKKLTKRRYGLILMDCQMPVLDGYETTRQIRKLEKSNEHIPIVAMTANAMTGDRALCLEAGMDDYLTKPLLRVQLAAVLEKYLPREKNPPTLHLIDNDRLQELFGDNETLKLEMLKMFIEHTGPLVEELNRACDIGEIPMVEVQAMGHRLAGSCLNLGADALGHLGRQIEDAARQANAGELRKLAKECLLTFDDMRHRISTSPKEHT